MNELTKYERNAIAEIRAWKNPKLGWFGHAMRAINWPFDKAGDAVFATPGVGVVLRKSIEGLTGVLNDAAQWPVRPHAIYGKYRDAGHQIYDAIGDDISKLRAFELREEADRMIVPAAPIPLFVVAYEGWANCADILPSRTNESAVDAILVPDQECFYAREPGRVFERMGPSCLMLFLEYLTVHLWHNPPQTHMFHYAIEMPPSVDSR